MTPEEEALFRVAARKAIEISRDVAFLVAELPEEAFLVVHFRDHESDGIGIFIPESWAEVPDMEERLHGILREESKRAARQSLD